MQQNEARNKRLYGPVGLGPLKKITKHKATLAGGFCCFR